MKKLIPILIISAVSCCGNTNDTDKRIWATGAPATYKIEAYRGEDIVWAGSGFVVKFGSKTFIVTAKHVVSDKTLIYRVKTTNGGPIISVSGALFKDSTADVSAFQVNIGGAYTELASRSPVIGDDVWAIGHPKPFEVGMPMVFSKGFVNAANYMGQTSISAQVYGGFSGGPVLNRDGRIVGVVSSGWSSANTLNYAVRLEDIRALLVSMS